MLQDIHRSISNRMNQSPQFGYGPECRWSDSNVRVQLNAWNQCSYLQPTLCDLERSRKQETTICSQRASRSSKRDAEAISILNKIGSTSRTLNASWSSAQKAIANPAEFFFGAAMKRTTTKLFPAWRGAVDLEKDPRAEALYKFLHDQSNGALDSTSSPIVREIQRESLLQILGHFKRLSSDLQVLTSRLEELRIDPLNTKEPRVAPPASDTYRPTPNLCQTLGTC
jgi:hypothetical protein